MQREDKDGNPIKGQQQEANMNYLKYYIMYKLIFNERKLKNKI